MVWLPDWKWYEIQAQKKGGSKGGAAKGAAKGAATGPKMPGAKIAGVAVKKTQLKNSQGQGNQQTAFLEMAAGLVGKQGMKQIQQMLKAVPEASGPSSGDQSKMLLSQFVSQQTGQVATKDVVVYNTEQVEGVNPPQFISEVTLATLNPGQVYKGQPQASKKAAEASAAAMALKKNGASKGQKGKGKGKKEQAPDSSENKKTMERLGNIEAELKVWIGGLPKAVSWKELETHIVAVFAKPSITHVMPSGKGVCSFKTAEEATACIAALNGTELKGKVLEADVWTQKKKA